MERYLEGKPIDRDAESLRKYIGQKIMSIHVYDIDERRCNARPKVILIEDVKCQNIFHENGDVSWIPDYHEFSEMEE